MRCLVKYLEHNGSNLSQWDECLVYFALPYVIHPWKHPSFKQLFNTQWKADTRKELKVFLESLPAVCDIPRLYELVNRATDLGKIFAKGLHVFNISQIGIANAHSALNPLKQSVYIH